MVVIVIIGLLATIVMVNVLPSQDRAMKEKAIGRFDATDDDKDGKISRAEAGKHSAYLTENFDKLDKNKDDVLDWEEFVGHNRWPR